jgi:hypothetical protein
MLFLLIDQHDLNLHSISTITLNDFKEYVKLKHGSSYIYHFKAQDPEFGIVKEVNIIIYL